MDSRRPSWTFTLIGICAVVFIIELLVPILQYTYFVPAYAFSRPWTFVTSIFLHADFSHLFFNMLALFIFGIYLEQRIGGKTFLSIFFISGIIGNLGYMLTAFNSTTPGLGASGAVYGIMGALAVLEPFAIVYIGFAPMPMVFAAIIWTITEFLGLFVPGNIAHGAHLAGLFVGAAFGFYLRRSRRRIRFISFI
jgi:membrane associated rhomboid family serine protease